MFVYLVLVLHVFFFVGVITDLLRSIVREESVTDWVVRGALAFLGLMSFVVGPTVFGLEYEDAYIHQSSARYFATQAVPQSDGFLLTLCAVGSLRNCLLEVTYGTHLIGFASLLYPIVRSFPNATHTASAVSCAATIILLQLYWQFVRKESGRIATYAGLLLLASAPALHIMGATGFAEPLYTLYLTSAIFFGLRVLRNERKDRLSLLNWLVMGSASFLLVATKKEGVLVVVVMSVVAVVVFISRSEKEGERAAESMWFFLLYGATAIFSVTVLKIGEAARRHTADIGAPAFSVDYLGSLLPAVVEAALDPRNFGFLWVTAVVAVPIVFLTRHRRGMLLAAIICAFVFLYSIHARHQGFINSGMVEPDEMVRYLFSLSPSAALLVTFAASAAEDRLGRGDVKRNQALRRGGAGFLAFLLIGLSLYQSREAKHRLYVDEVRRVHSVKEYASQRVSEGRLVISPFSAAIYAVLPPDAFVVDSHFWSDSDVRYFLGQ